MEPKVQAILDVCVCSRSVIHLRSWKQTRVEGCSRAVDDLWSVMKCNTFSRLPLHRLVHFVCVAEQVVLLLLRRSWKGGTLREAVTPTLRPLCTPVDVAFTRATSPFTTTSIRSPREFLFGSSGHSTERPGHRRPFRDESRVPGLFLSRARSFACTAACPLGQRHLSHRNTAAGKGGVFLRVWYGQSCFGQSLHRSRSCFEQSVRRSHDCFHQSEPRRHGQIEKGGQFNSCRECTGNITSSPRAPRLSSAEAKATALHADR